MIEIDNNVGYQQPNEALMCRLDSLAAGSSDPVCDGRCSESWAVVVRADNCEIGNRFTSVSSYRRASEDETSTRICKLIVF
jgi:hypothetical protein